MTPAMTLGCIIHYYIQILVEKWPRGPMVRRCRYLQFLLLNFVLTKNSDYDKSTLQCLLVDQEIRMFRDLS